MKNFNKIDDHVYRSGKLSPKDVLHLKDIGINQIISLDKDTGEEIAPVCKELKIKHKMMPIDINDKKSVKKILSKDLVSLLQDNGPTLIHCRAGKDRTGLVSAVYQLLTGETMENVKKKLFYFGFGIGLKKQTKDFYLKIINEVNRQIKDLKKTKEDSLDNADSIIGLSESYMDDPNLSYVEPPRMHSFLPSIDYRRSFPYDVDYYQYPPVIDNDEHTRYKKNQPQLKDQSESNSTLPLVGLYYNDINATRLGPLDMSGLFYD